MTKGYILKRWHIVPTSEGELAHLMRVSNGRSIHHTYATPGGGLIWPGCPWCLPILCDLRGETITEGFRELCNKMQPRY